MQQTIKINKIEEKTSRKGDKFFVIESDKGSYYVWKPELIANLNIGDNVSVEYTSADITGKDYRNITSISKVTEVTPETNQSITSITKPSEIESGGQVLVLKPKTEKGMQQIQQLPMDEFQLMEQKDDEQIMAELKGKVIDKYIYDFESHGRRIIGLSYSGVIAASRKQGNLRIIELKIDESKDKIIAKARGRDDIRNFEIFGVASQSKKIKTATGEFLDPHVLTKVVAKCQRNVLRRLIPETVITEMIKEYKNKIEKQKNNQSYPKVTEEKTL